MVKDTIDAVNNHDNSVLYVGYTGISPFFIILYIFNLSSVHIQTFSVYL